MAVTGEPSGGTGPAPVLAMPPRPARPLSTWQLLRVALSNTLAACDEELFEELVVERRFAWGRVIAISDPSGIKRVLQDNLDNYPRLDAIRRVFEFGSGTGMLCAEGEAWWRHRRALNPTLDHRAVLAETPMLIELAQALAGHLAGLPAGQQVNIGEMFTHLVIRSTGRVFAGDDRGIDPVVQRLGHFPGKYALSDFVPLPPGLRFVDRGRQSRAEARALHPQFDRLFGERRQPSYAGSRDLLWRMVHARDRQTGERLTGPELEDEALTLGSTAVTALQVYGWLWYLLALHPGAEDRLHAELDAVLGGRAPTPQDLPRLVYLRQVIDETMRLYPPIPIMLRRAAAADVVCGRRVGRRTIVAVMPWVVHRHRRLWASPDRFDPERFAPDQATRRSRFAYLPFSLGPRVCIGAALALTEITATVAVLAQRFRFRLAPGAVVAPIAWTNLRPDLGMRMTIEPRDAPARPA